MFVKETQTEKKKKKKFNFLFISFWFDLLSCLYTALFIVTIIISFSFGYLFYITYAINVRAACVIALYNDGSKVPIRLSGRGRSCLAFATFGMFGLSIAPKEKVSSLFKPAISIISIQK